jgi:murein DD-endopeptidase MepM/ murein hydrolase activator NlpD
VLAARFINQGKAHEALWFQDGNERGAYYAPDGRNKARSFLASPLAFSRVSSGFAMRMHPIHQTWRAHLGVDYAAAAGTPVRAVSEGAVEFAGVQGGYGNVVVVRHGNNRSTLYAHLSRIGVQKGQHISQGQPLGQVGSTGWATGPHLHFEFKLDGRQMDPVKMARNSEAQVLSAASRRGFELQVHDAQAQLAAAELPPVETAQFARME